ncbi:intron-binding protein aquarius [Tanacetum coccineum]
MNRGPRHPLLSALKLSLPFLHPGLYGLSTPPDCPIEILASLDAAGSIPPSSKAAISSFSSFTCLPFRGLLQANTSLVGLYQGAKDVYGTFNILMRRKPKENNFKAILESIRDLMNETCIVPDWLHDIFLGYGNPSVAQWTNMPDLLETVDFKDTFLDADHVREYFLDCQVTVLSTCKNVHGKGNSIQGLSATDITESISGEMVSGKTALPDVKMVSQEEHTES